MARTPAGRPAHTLFTRHVPPPARWPAGLGMLASTTVVISLTRAGPLPGVVIPDGPLGLWRSAQDGRALWSAVAVAGIALVSLAFVRLYLLARRHIVDMRCIVVVSGAWALPVLLGPPLLSLDVYSYLAQGELAARGFDPYTTTPMALGYGPVLDSVAPVWRSTPAPYGPLSLGLMGLLATLTESSHVSFILLLRLLTVASVVACGWAAVRLARPGSEAVALTLVASNPVVLLHLVGGLHFDVLIGALAGVTLLAVRRRWWWLAALAAALAFAIKLPGLVLVGYVLLARLHRPASRWLTGNLQVLAVTAGTVVVCAAMIPDGWGWLSTLDTPGTYNQPYAAPSLLAGLAHWVSDAAGAEVGFDALLTWIRLGSMAGASAMILVLLLRAREPGDMPRSGALVGGCLATVALAAPAIHPWYLSWCLVLVAAYAGAKARRWLVGAIVVASFMAVPESLASTSGGLALVLGLLVCTAGITAWSLLRHDGQRAAVGSAIG